MVLIVLEFCRKNRVVVVPTFQFRRIQRCSSLTKKLRVPTRQRPTNPTTHPHPTPIVVVGVVAVVAVIAVVAVVVVVVVVVVVHAGPGHLSLNFTNRQLSSPAFFRVQNTIGITPFVAAECTAVAFRRCFTDGRQQMWKRIPVQAIETAHGSRHWWRGALCGKGRTPTPRPLVLPMPMATLLLLLLLVLVVLVVVLLVLLLLLLLLLLWVLRLKVLLP